MIKLIRYDEEKDEIEIEAVDMSDNSYLVHNKLPIDRVYKKFDRYNPINPELVKITYYPVKLKKLKKERVNRNGKIKTITKVERSGYVWFSENLFDNETGTLNLGVIQHINSMNTDGFKIFIPRDVYRILKKKYNDKLTIS